MLLGISANRDIIYRQFLTEQGSGIGRLILNPFKKLLYSSHPEDEGAIRAYRAQGLSLSDAILQVLKDRNAI